MLFQKKKKNVGADVEENGGGMMSEELGSNSESTLLATSCICLAFSQNSCESQVK